MVRSPPRGVRRDVQESETTVVKRVHDIIDRYHAVEKQLASAEVMADRKKMEHLSREYNALGKQMPLLNRYLDITGQLSQARELLAGESDSEMIELAKQEIEQHEAALPCLEDKIRRFLVPHDPNDLNNAIAEIRAGTGGIEAGIFAADLYRMYCRYAESKSWNVEVLSSSYGELGSIKEIVFTISGSNAYGTLKFESGVHRVQRVPQTESQGRIHTSAASVAVFPEADEFEIDIDPADLRIDVFRSSGPGGQSVNTTDSAVRIVHEPSGLTVTCQDEKSQHKNKAKALKVLRTRLYDMKLSEIEQQESRQRRSMVGTGDRSAKIRTYNFPQGRVTDHRINLTLYKLEAVMAGHIDEVLEALAEADLDQRLKQAETQETS